MADRDTKLAEKQFLERVGSSAWERAKPFSPPGADTLVESTSMLHDFTVAMLALQPTPDELILDLGAGGCWCSDLLGRLNRTSIAVDIAVDMLRVGQQRDTPIRAVAADMEHLPFKTGAFDKAICLSALHHVPDIPKALREIARVLSPAGTVVFSEPGLGHSDAAVATLATDAYGVLEQEILVEPILRGCREAGFAQVHLQPFAYAIPGFTLDDDQWRSWTMAAASKRPRRALSKMARAALELVGGGKRGPLFEDTLAIAMVRALRQVIQHHPIIVARKQPAAAPAGPPWRAAVTSAIAGPIQPDGAIPVTVTARNVGTAAWQPATASGIGFVTLGVQALDANRLLLSRDHHRARLPHRVAPGESVTWTFNCPPYEPGGTSYLKFDLVAEGATWFELAGSTPSILDISG